MYTDLEIFKSETWGFILKVCPDSSTEKQEEAVNEIVKNFKWLFNKKGKRKALKALKDYYICQFCERKSSPKRWVKNQCPYCKRKYDAILAQEGDD